MCIISTFEEHVNAEMWLQIALHNAHEFHHNLATMHIDTV